MSEFEIAATNYRPLRYSHIKINPGADYVLTADPWSYLHSQLLKDLDSKRGKNRANKERAIFYLGLSQNFFRASDAAELPAKATLLYYGMLNLVKVWLSVIGVELEKTIEHHGISLPLGKKHTLEVSGTGTGSISIFAEFAKALRTPVAAKEVFSLEDVICRVPELHSTRKSLVPDEKQQFLSINISFLTDAAHKKLLTCMSYDKKLEGLVQYAKILSGARKGYFQDPENKDGKVLLKSKTVRTPANWKNLTRVYNTILDEYDEFNICSILTRSGYQYYLDLKPGKYHHLCYTLMLMYYLGTAARYRPSAVKQILEGDLRQSVTEACAICPRQFQYQLASRITNSLCVIPYARI
ncbi:YaaC family protein [Ruegeria sp. 2205SS24-7]|uniref:YaaC family protein n=1 Tax=Ruegeria discodermiae TaxID=3064389 RepID=UPI002740964E|nr:YaaC family protein [Ruegeria sp. 2205SS24-7]MDP5219314.1 YaaC family protein [Ruegeria sp. 2205SS24-7]